MKNGVFWVVTPCGSCKNRFLQEPHGVITQKTPFFNIKLDLVEIGWGDVDWTGLA
jgi:hypothetical protein